MSDPIEDARLHREALFQRLQLKPVHEVIGLLNERGQGCGQVRGEPHWTLSFELAAWRLDGAFPQQRPLLVQRRGTKEELGGLLHGMGAYSVLRFRARVIDEPAAEKAVALLESVPERFRDQALDSIAARLREPVTYQDSTLGTFTLDRRANRFTATVEWCGKPIELHLSGATPEQMRDALATAHALWKGQERWSARITQFATDSLLELKNSTWTDGDEDGNVPVVSEDEFKARMKLDEITVSKEGHFEFWNQDGDLFFGHSIEVRGNIDEGPTSAGIAG